MRSVFELLVRGAAGALAASLLVAGPAAAASEPEPPVRLGFGSVVLVGDGEVFVGESANNFRPVTVYVYRKVNGGWREVAKLSAPEPAVYDRFGSALALDGDRLFVGAGLKPQTSPLKVSQASTRPVSKPRLNQRRR